eukprot:1068032-Rhodomonas_salina.2
MQSQLVPIAKKRWSARGKRERSCNGWLEQSRRSAEQSRADLAGRNPDERKLALDAELCDGEEDAGRVGVGCETATQAGLQRFRTVKPEASKWRG